MITAPDTPFYVAGGTLPGDAPSYVERQADRDLLDGLLAGRYCYVLTARQMGKSSLMVRTANKLREKGVAVAVLDLTSLGQNVTAEQWYGGLLRRLGDQLDVRDALLAFWRANREEIGPLQRFLGAIREVLLSRVPGPVVLFVDEVDAVRSLPAFSADEFSAGIRECFNRRTEDPEMGRLTFCLLGVASPSDLIRDTRTTPFNIGTRIELRDFTPEEAAPLAQGMKRGEGVSRRLLARVLYWTGGHPYLTQRLCQGVAEDVRASTSADVDRRCEELFLAADRRENEDNLAHVRRGLLESGADLAALLGLYRQVWEGVKAEMKFAVRAM